MAEYWKSTPRYWCKHCSTYVRDTKLERTNHEATAKHQGAVKRALRELHRGHEREDRDKDRAKREIERLNGVVSGSGSASSSAAASHASRPPRLGARGGGGGGGARALTGVERKRQAEQLAELGVSIPDEFRGDLAMAGEWTVTSSTVVPERTAADDDEEEAKVKAKAEALSVGVRKRERTEDEMEQEEALRGLFKKPRRWGRDSRTAGGEDGAELDALLSGILMKKEGEEVESKESRQEKIKREDGNYEGEPLETGGIKQEAPSIKQEPSDEKATPDIDNKGRPSISDIPSIKTEEDTGAADAPAVAFKKRKRKHIRQK